MYQFLSKREQKATIITLIVNALAAAVILCGIFHPSQTISFTITWFIGILAFELNLLFFSEFIQRYLFKKISPLKQQQILRKKIKAIQEEIKRMNGQPYNEEKFHF